MWQFKDLIDPGAPHVTELLSVAALRSLDRIAKRAKNLLETNRTLFSQLLDAYPQVEVIKPQYGTCMFPRVNGVDGDRLFDVLQRYEVDVVPGRFFGMPGHFRIGIGGEPRMFAEALQRFKMAVDALTIG
jgi:aspartate/methionine/tyrosine aminotransferase